MDFVLALHSHLPYVLNHGRWPHGSDWICEAALDTYLPLLEALRGLADDAVASPVTIGFTPILANQLVSPVFVEEMEAFFTQRLTACDEAPASLRKTGDAHLLPLVDYWRDRLLRLRALFHAVGGDIISAFRALEAAGRIEIIGSAATHGFLPLLGRDESIRLQLGLGFAEHRRIFGRNPRGCWLPECAYRPRGPWDPWPGAPRSALRRGTDEYLGDAGFEFFFIDTHLAAAGDPLGLSSGHHATPPVTADQPTDGEVAPSARRTAYRAYGVMSGGHVNAAAFVRDPRASAQVWSRFEGYPGDGVYLEFHKMRWPGGLKLWRVSGPGTDLGTKEPYDPAEALGRAEAHGRHFAGLLREIAAVEGRRTNAVAAAPFDTELFGHWWFEGPDFLAAVYRALATQRAVRPTTGSAHLDDHPPRTGIRLPPGSWGANGDYSMWIGEATAWTWQRLWPLEESFWTAAPAALADPAAQPILAQAARSLLLAQSSDWQFIISTGAVVDYAERRFVGHCEDAEALIAALVDGTAAALERGAALAHELRARDDVFPDILPFVAAALSGTRAHARS
jgi:1,4-alpha-glucan branching enzyme